MLKIKPSAKPIRKSVAAIVRGTPAVIIMGSTIEPTMIIPPSPESDVKSSATIAQKPSESNIGCSPPYSAAKSTIVRAIPVSIVTRPKSAPKTTAA